MRTRLSRVLTLVLVLGLVSAACSKKTTPAGGTTGTTTETEGGTIVIGSDTANDHGTGTISGGTIDVEVDSFYFEPTVIKGTPGAQVTLNIKNDSQTTHNFTLQDQGTDQDIAADSTQPITVTIPQSGFVEFFCKYHKSRGMVGELSG